MGDGEIDLPEDEDSLEFVNDCGASLLREDETLWEELASPESEVAQALDALTVAEFSNPVTSEMVSLLLLTLLEFTESVLLLLVPLSIHLASTESVLLLLLPLMEVVVLLTPFPVLTDSVLLRLPVPQPSRTSLLTALFRGVVALVLVLLICLPGVVVGLVRLRETTEVRKGLNLANLFLYESNVERMEERDEFVDGMANRLVKAAKAGLDCAEVPSLTELELFEVPPGLSETPVLFFAVAVRVAEVQALPASAIVSPQQPASVEVVAPVLERVSLSSSSSSSMA